MPETVLFISHREQLCGIHQFGYQIGKVIAGSENYNFIYLECSSSGELKNYVSNYSPVCIIYNYNELTIPWLNKKVTTNYKIPQIGILHEAVSKLIAEQSSDSIFDFYIVPDPTLISKNPLVYNTGRLLLNSSYECKKNEIPVIGSFGFATQNKKFVEVVNKVCEEFNQAIIRFNIPFSKYGDPDGIKAKKIISISKEIIQKYPEIHLEYSHDFLSEEELLQFLSLNSINVFLYSEDKWERGISSVVDYALSVKIPLAICNNSTMFRHIINAEPSIVLSDTNKLKNIIANGTTPLEEFYNKWTAKNLILDYERIVNDVLINFKGRKKVFFLSRFNKFIKKLFKYFS
jgi:hypothetical protein